MAFLLYFSKDKIYWKSSRFTEVIITIKNQTTLIVCLCVKLIVIASSVQLNYNLVQFSVAQLIPIPPPAPDTRAGQTQNQASSQDNTPPVIQIVTTELTKGKNVLKVNVTDSSDIRLREVGFVDEGQIKTETLVYEGNGIYKALVDVNPPSAVIVVNVDDRYGNKANLAQSIPVKDSQNIVSQILDMIAKR